MGLTMNAEGTMPSNPTSEERLVASIAHASVVVFGPGILVGILLWLTQKEKASYASQQGLQAAVYQVVGMVLIMALWVLWGIFYALTWIPIIQNPAQFEEAPPPIFWIGLASMGIPLLVMLAWALYGLWGAYKTLRGQNFRYVLIGRLVNQA
jgi:uncharacterized Tic20 family protein